MIALHIVAWVLFFIVPGINNATHIGPPMMGPHPNQPPPPQSYIFWLGFSTLKNLLLIPLFYLNLFLILPKYLPSKRYVQLVPIELLLATIIFCWTQGISAMVFPGSNGCPHKYASIVAYMIVISVATGYYYYKAAAGAEALRKERETETLKSELQFLRWQISPHFLFNALNNMVSLARKKSDLLEPMLINLSGLMRYMLYETTESVVALMKEGQYLEDFIRLQSIRYDDVRLDTDINVPETPVYFIEPMLLIPFVENAFKHGIDGVAKPVIAIYLRVIDGLLHFKVSNLCSVAPVEVRDDASGVGLANVRKRLSLLYEGRHTLQIAQADWFIVSLKITLS